MEIEHMTYFFIKKEKQLLCKYAQISGSWKLKLGFGFNYGLNKSSELGILLHETHLNNVPTSLATFKRIRVKNLEIL